MCVRVHVCAHSHYSMMCKWRSEDNIWESFHFFHEWPGDQTQVNKFGSKHLYLLSHLVGPPGTSWYDFSEPCWSSLASLSWRGTTPKYSHQN